MYTQLPKGIPDVLAIPFISSPNGNGTWSARGAYQLKEITAVAMVTNLLPNHDQLMGSMNH